MRGGYWGGEKPRDWRVLKTLLCSCHRVTFNLYRPKASKNVSLKVTLIGRKEQRCPSQVQGRAFKLIVTTSINSHSGAGKSLARSTSRRILFDGENISFDASLVIHIYIYIHTHIHTYIHIHIYIYIYIYINSTNIPPIMIINRIYEHQNLPSL